MGSLRARTLLYSVLSPVHRSVLHKICEGDESCSRPMVLCVSHLNSTQGEDRGSVQVWLRESEVV